MKCPSLLEKDAKLTWSQFIAALTVGLASMVTGYTGGYTSPALVSLRETDNVINRNQGNITMNQESWIGFFVPLGALFGSSAIGGILIAVLGRKGLLMAIAPVYTMAWTLIGFAQNVPMIYMGRAICGLCVGLLTVVMPVYLGETLHESVRGMLGLLPTLLGNGGILVVFIVGYIGNWQVLALVGSVLPMIYFGLLLFIPETPRWLISKSKSEKARKSIQWLRGAKADITDELAEIEAFYANEGSEQQKLTFGEFKIRMKKVFIWKNIRPTLICVALMFFQQLSGINAVMFYMNDVFKDAGRTDEHLSTILVAMANVLATLASTFLVDRLGRKILLYVSGSFTTLLLGVIGGYFYFMDNDYSVEGYEWVVLVALILYVMAFSFGFGPIPWMMMGEVLPARIRGPAASIVTGSNWAFACIVTKSYVHIKEAIGNSFTFWGYGAICGLCVVFVFIFVPETRGRSLEDIESNMDQKEETKDRPEVKDKPEANPVPVVEVVAVTSVAA